MIDQAPDRLPFHLVCSDGVTRHAALDHPVHPFVEARARLQASHPTVPNK
jgi:hypothetical protein